MRHWINRNYRTIIVTAFLVPIITVAIVSISHVTKWYGISNPMSWAIYLSVGVEIAAMSALAAISANMGKKVYFPFIIVTLIQFIGNVFFAFEYIDVNSAMFKSWVDLTSPIVQFLGVEANNVSGHMRILALFAGGLLPVISLSFLHMLVKFTEEDRLKDIKEEENKYNQEEVDKHNQEEAERIKLKEDELNKLEHFLNNKKYKEEYDNYLNFKKTHDEVDDEIEQIIGDDSADVEKKTSITNEEKTMPNYTIGVDLANDNDKAVVMKHYISPQTGETVHEVVKTTVYDTEHDAIHDTEHDDKKDSFFVWRQNQGHHNGLSPLRTIDDSYFKKMREEYNDYLNDKPQNDVIIEESSNNDDVYPALSDEEVNEMLLDEWERVIDLEIPPTIEDIEDYNNRIEESEPVVEAIKEDESEDLDFSKELLNENTTKESVEIEDEGEPVGEEEPESVGTINEESVEIEDDDKKKISQTTN